MRRQELLATKLHTTKSIHIIIIIVDAVIRVFLRQHQMGYWNSFPILVTSHEDHNSQKCSLLVSDSRAPESWIPELLDDYSFLTLPHYHKAYFEVSVRYSVDGVCCVAGDPGEGGGAVTVDGMSSHVAQTLAVGLRIYSEACREKLSWERKLSYNG